MVSWLTPLLDSSTLTHLHTLFYTSGRITGVWVRWGDLFWSTLGCQFWLRTSGGDQMSAREKRHRTDSEFHIYTYFRRLLKPCDFFIFFNWWISDGWMDGWIENDNMRKVLELRDKTNHNVPNLLVSQTIDHTDRTVWLTVSRREKKRVCDRNMLHTLGLWFCDRP